MGKHAYLIMAHNQFNLLEILLELIDDDRNDIFLHIDKKVKDFDFDHFSKVCKKSKVIFIPRLDITWGSYNQVKCEIIAMKEVLKYSQEINERYDYLHWLSGVDLPLKTQDEIHAFFDANPDREYVHFDNKEISSELKERMKYYQFFRNKRPDGKIHLAELIQIFQKKLHVDRTRNSDWIIQKGSAFWTITQDLAEYIVSQETKIKKHFNRTLCGDEQFMQTMLINSPRAEKRYRKELDDDLIHSSFRIMDWDRGIGDGSPWTFRKEDFEMLIKSEAIFARKFNIDKYPEIVYMIRDYLNKKTNSDK